MSAGAGRSPGELFDRLAGRYDRWFEEAPGRDIFRVEVECLRALVAGGRWLEVGVGTGRFARALGVREGVDPSMEMLRYARRRGLRVSRARAEALPYPAGSFDGVLLVVTICFLDEPARAVAECRRVLREGGRMVVGLVPRESAWGGEYRRKARAGHAFYSAARFYTAAEVVEMAAGAGFGLEGARGCLFGPPGGEVGREVRAGLAEEAGFLALSFLRGDRGA